MALAAKKKIVKEKGQEPDDFEEQVAQVRGRSGGGLAQQQIEMLLLGPRFPWQSWLNHSGRGAVCRLCSTWRRPTRS
jgi:hypothetical protein